MMELKTETNGNVRALSVPWSISWMHAKDRIVHMVPAHGSR